MKRSINDLFNSTSGNASDFYGARNTYESDAVEVLDSDSGNSKFEKALKLVFRVPKLKEVADEIPVMVNMIRDYTKGKYKRIPFKTITLMTAGILYLANPADAVPDTIPVAGFVDDIAVINCILDAVEDDVDKYKEWKTTEWSA